MPAPVSQSLIINARTASQTSPDEAGRESLTAAILDLIAGLSKLR